MSNSETKHIQVYRGIEKKHYSREATFKVYGSKELALADASPYDPLPAGTEFTIVPWGIASITDKQLDLLMSVGIPAHQLVIF